MWVVARWVQQLNEANGAPPFGIPCPGPFSLLGLLPHGLKRAAGASSIICEWQHPKQEVRKCLCPGATTSQGPSITDPLTPRWFSWSNCHVFPHPVHVAVKLTTVLLARKAGDQPLCEQPSVSATRPHSHADTGK